MSRLIDADALKLSMMLIAPGETKKYCYPCKEILKEIDSAPTIEERRKGKWIKISPAGIYECSVCGQNVMTQDIDVYLYCHGCGAVMRGTP